MKTFTSVTAISILALAGAAQAGVCPGNNRIVDPVPFHWTTAPGGYHTGTIEIGEASFVIGNAGDTLTTRAYRQAPDEIPNGEPGGTFSIPGPTMRMMPGQTYVLTFKNTLPYEEPSPEHNVLKDPNITNIHTHGLHVSGMTPADDVTRLINGGQCGDYVYEIPGDHMGGSLWYHAHHHGSTWLQVAGGAFGWLIIDDSADGIPPDVAAMDERLLAIAFLDPSVAGAGGDTLVSGSLSPTWTVNGEIAGEGNLCVPVNEWQHWRVLLADADAKMKTVSVGPECEVALMARDGVWRTTAPLDLPSNSIDLTGASRADLAVKCSADSTISVGNTVVANVFADPELPADLAVGPYQNGSDPNSGTWVLTRPHYLRDLTNESVADSRSINMGARTVSGDKFDAEVPSFNIDLPGVQEWTIKGATNHPFHLHVYHQQVVQGGGCGPFEEGEHYDTIAANCDVRLDAGWVQDPLQPELDTAYLGRTIMHCHILEHEDQGAMTWADVTFGEPAPDFPDPNQQALYDCGGGPPVCEPTPGQELQETSCSDGVDNDCDGAIDDADSDCQVACEPTPGQELQETSCGDGVDNDCDGAIDGDDPDCQTPVDCSELDRNSCNAEPACKWSGRNKSCGPA
jgi:FtsP/CotA-like multicopper oxidase with cupredoxin domain